MELFYVRTDKVPCSGEMVILDEVESAHCTNVLRHRTGDEVNVIDGRGNLLKCRIGDDAIPLPDKKSKRRVKGNENCVKLEVLSVEHSFGGHGYELVMAVCPTKNMERYEWFVEKAVEVGLDSIVAVVGEHSERKVVNGERLGKIMVSAVKQSLKGSIPKLQGGIPVKEFCRECNADLKLICYCGNEVERVYICSEIERYKIRYDSNKAGGDSKPSVAILIGPEGDFSKDEVNAALDNGFTVVHLGASRLRTETAALVATVLTASVFEEEK